MDTAVQLYRRAKSAPNFGRRESINQSLLESQCNTYNYRISRVISAGLPSDTLRMWSRGGLVLVRCDGVCVCVCESVCVCVRARAPRVSVCVCRVRRLVTNVVEVVESRTR